MALLVNNIGEAEMLERILGIHSNTGTAGDTLCLRLFDNDLTPEEGDSFDSFTESDYGGGDSIKVLAGDTEQDAADTHWNIVTGAGDTTWAVYGQQTFSFDSGDTIFGYYVTTVTKDGDTIVAWSEKFTDGPYTIPAQGGTINITPRVELE